MLQLRNHTPFAAMIGVFANPEGVECAYGVVKATFALGGSRAVPAEPQPPVVLVDEYWGDPLKSGVKNASDMALLKPGTDVLLHGHAHAPAGERVRELDVSLKVGPVAKTVRVFGNRAWKLHVLGYKASDPEPFERMPLRYEWAFGGTDPQPRDPGAIDFEPRNPVGKGLVPRGGKLSLNPDGVPLPNLEDPRQLMKGPKDRPAPACFAPVAAHWEPRRSYAGTYDAAWASTRAPYLPADFDPRFFQAAPPDLVTKEFLKGGEPVEIVGAAPAGPLRFALPVCSLEVIFHLDGKPHRHVPNLDAVVFEPDAGRFRMVWRACQVVDKKLLRLSHLEVACKEYVKRKVA